MLFNPRNFILLLFYLVEHFIEEIIYIFNFISNKLLLVFRQLIFKETSRTKRGYMLDSSKCLCLLYKESCRKIAFNKEIFY